MTSARPSVAAADEILGRYFPVLDHGFVALIDYMGSDADIERAARVSYGYGTRATSNTRGLLRYLRRHRHTTPTEMVELKFHCCMPIFVARQWIRHRTASVNEYSGRYSLMPMVFYTPEREHLRTQSRSNKQGRGDDILPNSRYEETIERWQAGRKLAVNAYEQLTADDVAKEIARIDLPLSTYTQWYWKIDLHNLLHFLALRVDAHAQWEIQAYGQVMAAMMARVAPLSYEAWLDYDVGGVSLSYDELAVLRESLGNGGNLDEPIGRAREQGRLSPREVEELQAKLRGSQRPQFELDLTSAKTPEYFAERFAAAVPSPPETFLRHSPRRGCYVAFARNKNPTPAIINAAARNVVRPKRSPPSATPSPMATAGFT